MSAPFGDGRDGRGRFVRGNSGGPGNPHGGAVARLRAAILAELTEADVRAIVRALADAARAGDVRAARELFDRAVGRPSESDTLARIEAIEQTIASSELNEAGGRHGGAA